MAGVFFFLDASAVVDALSDAVGITVVTVFIKFVTVSKGMFDALFDGLSRSKPSCLFKILHWVNSSCCWICCCIWFIIGAVLEVAVNEESAVVWELEVDSFEISARVEEVAVVGAEVGGWWLVVGGWWVGENQV